MADRLQCELICITFPLKYTAHAREMCTKKNFLKTKRPGSILTTIMLAEKIKKLNVIFGRRFGSFSTMFAGSRTLNV